MMRRMACSDTAVSESLGYVLIVFILLMSFVMIYLIGYPIYNSYVDSGHMQNVQKSFSIIAHNGNEVALQQSPYSSSELKMYGGSLITRDAGFLNITYFSDAAGNNPIGCNNTTLSVMEYVKGTDRVAYVDGSVCYAGLNGAVMLEKPEIYGNDDMLFVPIIVLYNSEFSLAGKTLARITFMTPYYSKMSQTIASPGPATFDVRRVDITIGGDYAEPIGQHLQDELGFSESISPEGNLVLGKTYPAGIKLILSRVYLTIKVN